MAVKKLKNTNLEQSVIGLNDNASSSVSSLSFVEGLSLPLWGGHFVKGANEFNNKILTTISNDKRLYAVFIESCKAQFKVSMKRGIVTESIGRNICDALDKIRNEIAEGNFEFKESQKSIYENIEYRLKELVGKDHEWFSVARAQSNQVAGDLRCWVKDACETLDSALQNLQAALLDKAEENVKTIFPGAAHAQLTQPVSFGHHLMAYVEMMARDRSRFKDAHDRMNMSPYGSGDIAGNSFNISREMMARSLGFDKACQNSVDAINDRDFVVEFTSCASVAAMHISRLATEMINWHSSQNGYISFSGTFVTQSVVVPYKRDPETLEGIRGKTGKVYGALFNVLSTMKGLPLEYSFDYQEAIEPTMDAFDSLLMCINSMAALVADFKINRKQMKEAASHSFSTAIDLVDWLVQNCDLTPVEAQETSRNIIEYAINKGKKLSLLDVKEMQKFNKKINDDIYSALIPSRAMILRRSGNGSNPVQVRKAIRVARRKYL